MAKAAPITGLDYNGPVEPALRIILAQRLAEMVSLRKRALNFHDPEGIHDMRVSSRRLRSALRDFEDQLGKVKVSRQLKEIRALAACLGEVRDDDVAIIALEKLLAAAPPEVVEGLHRIIAERKTRRKEAQKELVSRLSYRGLHELQTSFNQALAPLHPKSEDNGKPGLTYKALGEQVIRRRIRELQKLSSSLHNPNKVKPLHDMRIAAKRLRYAVELFSPCWKDSLKPYAVQIAKLQTSLGELHDLDLWIDYCGERLRKLSKPKGDPKHIDNSSLAIDEEAVSWLMGQVVKMRAKHFRDALMRWHDWKSKDMLGELKRAIEPEKQIEESDFLAAVEETVATEDEMVSSSSTNDSATKDPATEAAVQPA
jgi:CHAD domain-containing protein